MQIDLITVSLWIGFFVVGFFLGGMWLYNKGIRDGAKDYEMIADHLKRLLIENTGTDSALKEIEELADAIRKGSE